MKNMFLEYFSGDYFLLFWILKNMKINEKYLFFSFFLKLFFCIWSEFEEHYGILKMCATGNK